MRQFAGLSRTRGTSIVDSGNGRTGHANRSSLTGQRLHIGNRRWQSERRLKASESLDSLRQRARLQQRFVICHTGKRRRIGTRANSHGGMYSFRYGSRRRKRNDQRTYVARKTDILYCHETREVKNSLPIITHQLKTPSQQLCGAGKRRLLRSCADRLRWCYSYFCMGTGSPRTESNTCSKGWLTFISGT